MAQDGEAIKDIFFLIPDDPLSSVPVLPLAQARLTDCCSQFALKVLADLSDPDPFKNDQSGFLFWFNDVVTDAVLKLLQFDPEVGDWVEVAVLNDSSYGTEYLYGFFINDEGEKFVGYQLNWGAVLTLIGTGSFKVRCEIETAFGGSGYKDTLEYCLKAFSTVESDETIRIEYYLSGINGQSNDDHKVKDFGSLNWFNSLRLPGYFGYPNATYTKDYIQYKNGQRDWVEDEQEPEFILSLYPVSQAVHDLMRTDVLQADQILITDYNSRNPGKFIEKDVQPTSEYAPDWKRMQSKLAPVEVKFRQTYNLLRKRRC